MHCRYVYTAVQLQLSYLSKYLDPQNLLELTAILQSVQQTQRLLLQHTETAQVRLLGLWCEAGLLKGGLERHQYD